MSFIANIAWQRPRPGPPEYKRFGAIWYSEEQHRCSLLLDGIRPGQFFGKPHAQASAPYLKGDIMVLTRVDDADMPKKQYLWCGWMWTDSNQDGVIYNGVIEVDPTPSLVGSTMNRVIAEWRDAEKHGKKFDPRAKSGFWLPVHLEDKE